MTKPDFPVMVLMAGALTCSLGCGEPELPIDAAVAVDASGASDARPSDAGADDGGTSDGGLSPDAQPDAGPAISHYGVVSVGDVAGAAFVGQIRGAFVSAAELPILLGVRVPIVGAPDCYEWNPPPPVVPDYQDAGRLLFQGLILATHSVEPGPEGDYAFDYANLLETPGAPIKLTVPGGPIVESFEANVVTPDPAMVGNWTQGSTGVHTSWTAGNGDHVLLRFANSEGVRVCEVPDTGSFLVPAAALAPDDVPDGGYFVFQRVVETTVTSPSGTQELRLRAFSEDQIL